MHSPFPRAPFPRAAARCPACRVPLETTDRQGVRLDQCPQCLWLWLDPGAIDTLLEGSSPRPAPAPPPPRELGGGGGWLGHFQPPAPDRGFGRKPTPGSPYEQVDVPAGEPGKLWREPS